MTAMEALTQALVRLAAAGGRPPCGTFGDSYRWTSDDQADRLIAVVLCGSCPVLEVCGQAGEEGAELGVWGGRDLGVTVLQRKRMRS